MKRIQILLGALFLAGTATAQTLNCANCVNLAPTGNMMQITSSGQGSLNTMGTDWLSSHGSPSYSPGSLWMWSYDNIGEGVYYQGFNFTAGHTYCVTIDTYTRTHDNSPAVADAGYNIVATSSMVPNEVSSGGGAIPAIPAASDMVASVNWATLPMNGWSTTTYTFTATGNWSQLWFFPHASALPQVELTLQNLRICDITPANPCDYHLSISYDSFAGCGYEFQAFVNMAPGLSAIAYLWEFGDGTTSSQQSPVHYYASPGPYLVRLTVLVVNQNGKCCPRVTEIWVEAQQCDPCKIIDAMDFTTEVDGNTVTITASGPNTPNYVYYWEFGDGTKGVGHTVSHTYASPGLYSITLHAYYFNGDTRECCSIEIKKDIYIYPVPVINPPTGNEPAPGGEKSAPASPTGFTDTPEWLKERPSAETPANKVGIFPNPTGGAFTVMSMTENIRKVQVSDAQGRLLLTVNGNDKKSVSLTLQDQKPGAYTISTELVDGTKNTQTVVRN